MVNKPVLVVMAAGMGSRYGGLKQMDPIGPSGEFLMEYSLYDAYLAGFRKVVFIIKKELEDDFRSLVGSRISSCLEVCYVYQEITDIPAAFTNSKEISGSSNPFSDRTKPWGTGHAVLAARTAVKEPFCVMNADDFYGRQAFAEMYRFLETVQDTELYQYAMVGYRLINTLAETGSLSRGICVSRDGFLDEIVERTHIELFNNVPKYTLDGESWYELPSDAIVSMNLWGFTPGFFQELEKGFVQFLKEDFPGNPLKSEFYLPFAVNELLSEKRARAAVLTSEDKWYGVTYKEDKPSVMKAIRELVDAGVYRENLWEDAVK